MRFISKSLLNLTAGMFLAAAMMSQMAMAASIGSVSNVELDAYGTPPAGQRANKKITDGVVINEALETVPNGSLSIDFVDDTNLLLGGDAQVTVDELVFDPASNQGNAAVRLAKGVFFWTSGKIANKEAIRIDTPLATIGIRGTAFSIQIGPDGRTNVAVISGLVDFVSKATGQQIEITPGSNATVDPTGQLSALLSGIPDVQDAAVNAQIVFSAKKALAAAKLGASKSTLTNAQKVMLAIKHIDSNIKAKRLAKRAAAVTARSAARDAARTGAKMAAKSAAMSAAKSAAKAEAKRSVRRSIRQRLKNRRK